MAVPQRDLILDQIAAALGNIKTSTGYRTTVDTVGRVILEWHHVGKQQLPYIGFMPRNTRYTHQSSQDVRAVMVVDIVFIVQATTDIERSTKLSELEDDVWVALTNPTLNSSSGGNDLATMVKVMDFATDEGDPDTMGSKGGLGTGHLTIELIFHRTTGETT